MHLKRKLSERLNFKLCSTSFCIQFIDTFFTNEEYFCLESRADILKITVPPEIKCNLSALY